VTARSQHAGTSLAPAPGSRGFHSDPKDLCIMTCVDERFFFMRAASALLRDCGGSRQVFQHQPGSI